LRSFRTVETPPRWAGPDVNRRCRCECKFNCKDADRDAAAKNAANGRRYEGNGKTGGSPDRRCQDLVMPTSRKPRPGCDPPGKGGRYVTATPEKSLRPFDRLEPICPHPRSPAAAGRRRPDRETIYDVTDKLRSRRRVEGVYTFRCRGGDP
jgi:hypothetical protein